MTKGLGQFGCGFLGDRMGRKPFIVGGLGLCSASLVLMSLVGSSSGTASAVQLGFTVGALGLVRPSYDTPACASLTGDWESQGVGTTMMYSNLLAAVADEVSPTWRASALGTYRFWRDSGYFIGAMASGAMADAFGIPGTVLCVAAMVLCTTALVQKVYRA